MRNNQVGQTQMAPGALLGSEAGAVCTEVAARARKNWQGSEKCVGIQV
jgi:hypothetical protein